jgi:hypothetical protein
LLSSGWTDELILRLLRDWLRRFIEDRHLHRQCRGPCECREVVGYLDAEFVAAIRAGRPEYRCGAFVAARRIDGERAFALVGPPFGADRQFRPLPQAGLAAQAWFLAVPVRNSGTQVFASDLVLQISGAGRDELARYQVFVADSWTSQDLLASGQDVEGMGVSVAGLDVGQERTVYFPVDAVDCLTGRAEVEFALRHRDAQPGMLIQAVVGTVQVVGPARIDHPVVVAPAVASSNAADRARAGNAATTTAIARAAPRDATVTPRREPSR